MTEYQEQDLAEVESLLESRQQVSDWLAKLERAATRTPPAVRNRVRADYQARLAQIVEQLRGHSDVISSTLGGLRSQAEEYDGLRTEEREALAEAELRFTVGEFGQDEWSRVEADATAKIADLDVELERLSGEIGRLEDVLGQIVPAEPPAAREPARAETARPAEPAVVEPSAEPPPAVEAEPRRRPAAEVPEAPRFTARGGRSRESGPARTIQFPMGRDPAPPREPAPREAATNPVDELTFLKSMTLDSRPSGAAAPSTTVEKAERPSQTVPKTLKCGECGSLNRPTDWYCERCGAELAAV